MKKFALCLALVGLMGFAGQAQAVIGTIDDVPAATLLLPYFEVDLNDTVNGVNTLFSINNASATAVLGHVTVWSDQSVPVLDFDVYLTGYDVVTISMRDIFTTGALPQTASAGQDTGGDTISPQGPISQDINFASCSDMPFPVLGAGFRAHLVAWLQGNQSPSTGNCAGSKQPDTNVLRGYVTVDTVNACNTFFPSDWAFYGPFVTDQNVLWGDYFYVDAAGNFAQGETLVSIESCPTCFVPGDHTFYGRYNAASADDAREPLPTTMGARYLNGGPFNGGTDFLIWREANAAAAGYSCALQGPASWYPLEAVQIACFDEEEQVVTSESCRSGDPTCEQDVTIPNEANRTDVGAELLTPGAFGWCWLNLQHPDIIAQYGDDDAQMWLTTVMSAEGRFAVGFDGFQVDNANTPNTVFLPIP